MDGWVDVLMTDVWLIYIYIYMDKLRNECMDI